MNLPRITQTLLAGFGFSREKEPMNTNVPVLTEELLATFRCTENGDGQACPNVLIFDPKTMKHIECDVWIYPKGVYLHDEESFVFTDITSNRNFAYMEAHRREGEPELDYAQHVRHFRVGLISGAGKAIIGRSEVAQCLQTKRYHVG